MSTAGRLVRSFVLEIYAGADHCVARWQLPLGIAAPFANRVWAEGGTAVPTEPGFVLVAQSVPPEERPLRPRGPTSVYGDEYDLRREPPPGIQLHPRAGVRGFDVRLFDLDRELFRGGYTTDDVFRHTAHILLLCGLAGRPDWQEPYYYAVHASEDPVHIVPADLLPDDAYRVEGVFRLPPRRAEGPRIQFRPIPEPPLPECPTSRFGRSVRHGGGSRQEGDVFVPAEIFADLSGRLPLRRDVEEGGYMLGNVYRPPGGTADEGGPGFRWLVEVTDLVMAEGTVGSPARLLFTGDTWSQISRRRDRDYADRRLVGWFHTHLFPANDRFGLSHHDQDLHSWYLPRPWQIALLLNLEADGTRVVRCYQRGGGGVLVETPFEVFDPGSKGI